jgi:hypothetical protein
MKTKTVKIALDSFSSFLGREKGCLVVRDNAGKAKRYPRVDNAVSKIRIASGDHATNLFCGAPRKAHFESVTERDGTKIHRKRK